MNPAESVEFPASLKEHEKYIKSSQNVKKNISHLFPAQVCGAEEFDVWP